ncbi:hypothetical protein [Methylobacterium sp. SyP6R]|uniref:hypothetical protein n=1 Tax=Methylobacterium sp. SyP6R TaxID=2718876 RepID=UPI001F3CFC06|nr:hypothetical protein [Methylobacterium sp. SyP6R]MCF4128367.1 hypothetical protein [Methylobacterium sp. SyP6R]
MEAGILVAQVLGFRIDLAVFDRTEIVRQLCERFIQPRRVRETSFASAMLDVVMAQGVRAVEMTEIRIEIFVEYNIEFYRKRRRDRKCGLCCRFVSVNVCKRKSLLDFINRHYTFLQLDTQVCDFSFIHEARRSTRRYI